MSRLITLVLGLIMVISLAGCSAGGGNDSGDAPANASASASAGSGTWPYESTPDACAILDISGTDIHYPVMKNDDEPQYYLRRDWQGKDSRGGALFIDEYNDRDMNDPVVIVYGHQMADGTFFGKLQEMYQSSEGFEKYREVTLETPNFKRQYRVFAAVPYNTNHILYNYDFNDEMQFYVFMDRVYQTRSLNAQMDMEAYPQFGPEGKQVLILSTCLKGDSSQRYLVLAQEVDK